MVADLLGFLSQSAVLTALIAYIFALWVVLTIWTWFDVSARTGNYIYRLGALILVALGSLLGFVIYLMLRPFHTKDEVDFRLLEEKIFESQSLGALCYNCDEVVEPEFTYCVNCGVRVKDECVNCQRMINHLWKICPHCSTPKNRELKKESSVLETTEGNRLLVIRAPIISLFVMVRNIILPKVSLGKGGKKRGRPKKEKVEDNSVKRPRGRPRKEITSVSTEA